MAAATRGRVDPDRVLRPRRPHPRPEIASGRGLAGPAASAGPAQRGGGGVRVEALAALQAELADLRVAVNRVGTNLNQAVAALHATGQAPLWLPHVVELAGGLSARSTRRPSRVHRRLS